METTKKHAPVCMAEAFWKNTYLSIARLSGGVRFNGHQYLIVNKEGKDLWECTAYANKNGLPMAIMPGEPADLVRVDFIPTYKRLGREAFLEVLEANQTASDKELKAIYKTIKKQKKNGTEKES